jgi:cobalt/nickel transport system permease protein
MVCLIVAVVVVTSVPMAIAGLAIAAGIVRLSRLPLRFVAKRLMVVVPFVFTLCLVILFTHPGGREIVRFGALAITSEGLERAALIAARAMAAVALVLCMLGTMRFENTLKALEHLRVPTKVTQLLMFTYRYIFVLVDDYSGMSRSLSSRGFEKRTSLRTLTTLAKVIGMLFIRSYERAERVYHAMASRGYSGKLETVTQFKMDATDIAKAALLVALGLAINLCGPWVGG